MKRLIIPENFVRALCKIDRRIYGYGRCSDAVEAAIGYVSGKYQFQKEAAQAHGVSRYKAHAASHVIYKSWQENRVAVLADWIDSDEFEYRSFAMCEAAAVAAGIDTTNGLFLPLTDDDSAFKLSVAIKPDQLETWDGLARCKKEIDGHVFVKCVVAQEVDDTFALRCALFSVAVDIGWYKINQTKGAKNASNN